MIDETILSFSSDSLIVESNGLYTVTVEDNQGCEVSDTFSVFNINISEIFTSGIEIYPNPSNGYVNISFNLLKRFPSMIRIINFNGDLLKEF